MKLSGKRCVISGASRGLGAAIAGAMWAEGASLLLLARSASALSDVAASLPRAAGQTVSCFPVDISAAASARAVTEEAVRVMGGIDVLVNNAAVHGPVGEFRTSPAEEWERVLLVNFIAPTRLVRECLPLMGRGSKIIFLSGGGSTGPRPNFSAYGAAKTAIVRFAETLAEELRSADIGANCIAPGAMPTELLKEVLSAGPAKAGQREYDLAVKAMAGGNAVIDKASRLAVYLASSESDGVTGKLISAVWDPWPFDSERKADIVSSDIYTLRRIVPQERGKKWS